MRIFLQRISKFPVIVDMQNRRSQCCDIPCRHKNPISIVNDPINSCFVSCDDWAAATDCFQHNPSHSFAKRRKYKCIRHLKLPEHLPTVQSSKKGDILKFFRMWHRVRRNSSCSKFHVRMFFFQFIRNGGQKVQSLAKPSPPSPEKPPFLHSLSGFLR